MKKELEINGVIYKLVANREVSSLIEKGVKVDKFGNAKVDMPDKERIFYALLKTEQPDITYDKAREILAIADEEYGIAQMNKAIDYMFETVFTQGSNDKKTISWLEEPKTETAN